MTRAIVILYILVALNLLLTYSFAVANSAAHNRNQETWIAQIELNRQIGRELQIRMMEENGSLN